MIPIYLDKQILNVTWTLENDFTDTDKDFVKTGRISGLISGIYYWDDLKR